MKKEIENWVLIRDGEVRNVFKNRREAVKFFKEILNQVLEDFKDQDKTDEYNYRIEIPKIEIKPIEKRESDLGF